ncbi:mRNA 3' end processing factor [Metarhizium acridum]|nr:mRNA 3' end processing factor [Metarhizium acridum]
MCFSSRSRQGRSPYRGDYGKPVVQSRQRAVIPVPDIYTSVAHGRRHYGYSEESQSGGGSGLPANAADRRGNDGLLGQVQRRRCENSAEPAGGGAVADDARGHHQGRHQVVADQDARVRQGRRPALRFHLGLSQVGTGNDADAALYYLARMLQSGEDPLFIARRMVVIASEDVGLADNTLLPLATATFTATQQIGMPEARIPLAHCAIALSLAPKSTRAYRALNNAYAALREPGVASLPVPLHLRNAPTRLMRDMGYGAEYKYPPNYRDGKVRQTYFPDELIGRRFLEERHLGTEVDPDLVMGED